MKQLTAFRSQFDFQSIRWKDIIRWFPGHMRKGMTDLEESLPRVDGIIEIHDARIPHSGRNSQLYKKLCVGHKPHILILNKSDLADRNYLDKSIKYIQSEHLNTQVIHTSLEKIELKEMTSIFGYLLQQIIESPNYKKNSIPEYNLVVCGIPNVGKSTFINKLRNLFANKSSCERVGANPGVTRALSEKIKISHRPKVYIRDSPGILEPRLKSPHEAFRLILTNSLPLQNHDLSNVVADYGLFLLNKYEKQRLYMQYCQLDRPTDNILDVLISISKIKNCVQQYKDRIGYDLLGAARHFITEMNKGTFGEITLDKDILDEMDNEHIKIYKTLAFRWQTNPSFLHRNLKYVYIARTNHSNRTSNHNPSIEEIFKSRLDEILKGTSSSSSSSSSLLRGDAFNLHLRGWSYDSTCLPDRRGIKYNVSFDLSASCLENNQSHSSNVSRTMKLGRIDSVLANGTSSLMNEDIDEESSTISFHVSTKYTYTLTFTCTVTCSRGEGNKGSIAYGKRVQLDQLFDVRQPMSTIQSLEIQLTPVVNDEQDISKINSSQFPTTFTIYFDLTREAVETVRTGASTRKRQPISPSKIPATHQQEQQYHDPNAKRMKTSQRSSKISNTNNNSNTFPLWRDISPNNEHNSSTNLPLFYNFLTENKQCLATSYMSSRGHCCLCQFTAINNDLNVLIKHLSYCHPRFRVSLKKHGDRPNIELRINAFYDGSLDTRDMFSDHYPRKRRVTSELILWRPPRFRRVAMDDAPFVCRRAALTRVYRHTTGAQPIEPEHIQIDSDDEIYPEWTQQLSRRMMEEFQDVNEGEKEMMIMWNHHVMKHNFIADSQMPYACELFVEKHAKDLQEKNLVKNFYLHLATLQLYNLIKKTDLAKSIVRLKTILASTTPVSS